MRPSIDFVVRPFATSDRTAIEDIGWRTGYMGEPADGHFGDRQLFDMLFVSKLLEFTPTTCLVATSSEQVVGYCLVVADTVAFRDWQRRVSTPRVMRRVLTATLWRWPRDVWRLVRCDFALAR